MKKRLFLLFTAFVFVFSGCAPAASPETTPTTAPITQPATEPTTEPTQAPTETVPPDPTITQPQEESFLLSFAGDCTFGDNFDAEGGYGGFTSVVGDDYAYPLEKVRDIFLADDFSFVNLECVLTESDPTPAEMEVLKENLFRFRGPQAYANILVEGGVEFASCANNHSRDYGKQGLQDTWDALEATGLSYASFGKISVTTTQSGLTIGTFAVFFGITKNEIAQQVAALKNQGAELIVMSIHWGNEGTFQPNKDQKYIGHLAIDAGVDIVYGHHSHTLQPVEFYGDGVIYYSLGNFSFGGNRWPKERDTAILQQEVIRDVDGTITLGGLNMIPCSVSSTTAGNNFQPVPYETEDAGYSRALSKLQGTYAGGDIDVPYNKPTEPSETTEATEVTDATDATDPTGVTESPESTAPTDNSDPTDAVDPENPTQTTETA